MKDQVATTSYWLGADWGTSYLRVWVVDANGQVIERLKADCGMARISSDQFEAKFLALVNPLLSDEALTKVICCGMAGSFGYEKEHYKISMQVGEDTLFPKLRKLTTNARKNFDKI